jgi:co-chaperonin GroES (HSP10)
MRDHLGMLSNDELKSLSFGDEGVKKELALRQRNPVVELTASEIRAQAVNTSGLAPVEYKILIQPESVEETDEVLKSARMAGIALPDKATDRERMAQVRGVLVAVGGNAFEGWQEPIPKVGDVVYYAKYAGLMVKGKDDSELRLANDKDISAIVSQ